jgi:hypothetical protein
MGLLNDCAIAIEGDLMNVLLVEGACIDCFKEGSVVFGT